MIRVENLYKKFGRFDALEIETPAQPATFFEKSRTR
jgi:hypothetical protein